LNQKNPYGQDPLIAQNKWISEKIKPRIPELWLWQELRSKKIPKSIFGKLFSII